MNEIAYKVKEAGHETIVSFVGENQDNPRDGFSASWFDQDEPTLRQTKVLTLTSEAFRAVLEERTTHAETCSTQLSLNVSYSSPFTSSRSPQEQEFPLVAAKSSSLKGNRAKEVVATHSPTQ